VSEECTGLEGPENVRDNEGFGERGGDTGIEKRHGGSRGGRCDVMPRAKGRVCQTSANFKQTWLEPNRHLSELYSSSAPELYSPIRAR
jgi:hypothetical protein